jgi:ABC-type ATPase involved in cell division
LKHKKFEKVLNEILIALDSDIQQFIYLTGAAGTGKTTLIEKILKKNNLKNCCCPYWGCCIKYWW